MKYFKGYLLTCLLLFSSVSYAEDIDISKPNYNINEKIIIFLKGLKPDKEYWVGIYPKLSDNYWENVVSWPLKNIINGSTEVESIDDKGEYEARLFYKDSYELLDIVKFDVGTNLDAINCDTLWYKASLTYYTSYPDPDDYEECVLYSGCEYQGLFYGLNDGAKSEEWVENNNIVAVHSKDWDWLGLKEIRIKQASKEIIATVYDICLDSDCNDCCTRNLGNNNFLIDMEKYTKERFGSSFGTVEFQICY